MISGYFTHTSYKAYCDTNGRITDSISLSLEPRGTKSTAINTNRRRTAISMGGVSRYFLRSSGGWGFRHSSDGHPHGCSRERFRVRSCVGHTPVRLGLSGIPAGSAKLSTTTARESISDNFMQIPLFQCPLLQISDLRNCPLEKIARLRAFHTCDSQAKFPESSPDFPKVSSDFPRVFPSFPEIRPRLPEIHPRLRRDWAFPDSNLLKK